MEYELIPLNHDGLKVVTFEMIDKVHRLKAGRAARTFQEHKDKLIEGVDYFHISKNDEGFTEIRSTLGKPTLSDITLITEAGYYLIVKPLSGKRAWEAQRFMRDCVFSSKGEIQTLNKNAELLELGSGYIKDALNSLTKAAYNQSVAYSESAKAIVDLKGDVNDSNKFHNRRANNHNERILKLEKHLPKKKRLCVSVRNKGKLNYCISESYFGRCPLCNKRMLSPEIDHYYGPSRRNLTETWIICGPATDRDSCHYKLTHDVWSRTGDRLTAFEEFQRKLTIIDPQTKLW